MFKYLKNKAKILLKKMIFCTLKSGYYALCDIWRASRWQGPLDGSVSFLDLAGGVASEFLNLLSCLWLPGHLPLLLHFHSICSFQSHLSLSSLQKLLTGKHCICMCASVRVCVCAHASPSLFTPGERGAQIGRGGA